MDKKAFLQIADKISKGIASEEEVALFNFYYNKFQSDNQRWEITESHENLEEEIRTKIDEAIKSQEERPVRSFTFSYTKVAAAIALLIISAGLLYIIKQDRKDSILAGKTEAQYKNDVSPGGNKAVLTLADGSSIVLDESENGRLATQGDMAINKTGNGKIVYQSAKAGDANKSGSPAYNVITVPRGGSYRLTLPDGTEVWLNASSSLKFPVSFDKNERLVELKGEAYFEVAYKQKAESGKRKAERLPFVVKSDRQVVEVLGTHFNINAYGDEAAIKTTLLEGRVRVTAGNKQSPKDSKLLRPGEQSELRVAQGVIIVNEVDTEEAVAWKNGMFQFNNSDLKSIMSELERWYDIEVDTKDMPEKRFNGIIPRNVKLSQVLGMMEKTSGLKFKIEGRRVSMLQ
ncbi:FecR family protein [Arcticibacter tournemirensis]|nr:FecR domain-containing protein [Arcticibacter tournemirensis]